jgi:hypothetical protein
VALGIVPGSRGALVELTNQELRDKSLIVAGRQKFERRQALTRELNDEFDRTLRADTFNVDSEMRKRLGREAVSSIIGIPRAFYSDDGSPHKHVCAISERDPSNVRVRVYAGGRYRTDGKDAPGFTDD